MRVYLVFIWICFLSFELFAEPPTLQETMKNYRLLLKDLDSSLKEKVPECSHETEGNQQKSFCSVKDFCSMGGFQSDKPIFYQNLEGRKIVNEGYYQDRENLRACLKEKHADEIKSKREQLLDQLGNPHLKKIIAANKKLNKLADKYKQGTKILKIANEVSNICLEMGIKNEEADWDKDHASKSDLAAFIKRAEKRAKITLHPEIKATLVEIQFLKRNPLYLEQVDKIERELFPETKLDDPLYNWDLLKDEKMAGGKKKLELNRSMLAQKTRDTYDLFLETQKELISYLESKKTEENFGNIERIIKKVKTITFNPPRLTKNVENVCETPNAFYNSHDHSLTICPQMLNFPKMPLMETIVHEIAHSFDSCFFSTKLYKKSGPRIEEEAPFEIDLEMDDVGSYVGTLNEDPAYAKAKNKIYDRALYRDHPFSKTLSCLKDPLSVGARSINLDEFKSKTKAKLDELNRLGQNKPHNLVARYVNYLNDNQDEFFDHFQGCNLGNDGTTVGKSQMQEAFSDKIASEVMARKLKTLPKVEAEKAMLEIMLSYGDLCSENDEHQNKIMDFATKENCPNYFENRLEEEKVYIGISLIDPKFDPHPEAIKRIERNHLAHPEIRNALKCPADPGVKYCE